MWDAMFRTSRNQTSVSQSVFLLHTESNASVRSPDRDIISTTFTTARVAEYALPEGITHREGLSLRASLCPVTTWTHITTSDPHSVSVPVDQIWIDQRICSFWPGELWEEYWKEPARYLPRLVLIAGSTQSPSLSWTSELGLRTIASPLLGDGKTQTTEAFTALPCYPRGREKPSLGSWHFSAISRALSVFLPRHRVHYTLTSPS